MAVRKKKTPKARHELTFRRESTRVGREFDAKPRRNSGFCGLGGGGGGVVLLGVFWVGGGGVVGGGGGLGGVASIGEFSLLVKIVFWMGPGKGVAPTKTTAAKNN